MAAPAAAPKKADVKEDPVKQYYELQKKFRAWIDTHKIIHSDAYTSVAKKHLFGEDGTVDYKKLENADVRKNFVDDLIKHYITHLEKTHKIKVPAAGSPFAQDDLLYIMTGHTRGAMEKELESKKSNYTIDAHAQFTEKHLNDINERHGPAVQAPLFETKNRKVFGKLINLDDKILETMSQQELASKVASYVSSDLGQRALEKQYSGKQEYSGADKKKAA